MFPDMKACILSESQLHRIIILKIGFDPPVVRGFAIPFLLGSIDLVKC